MSADTAFTPTPEARSLHAFFESCRKEAAPVLAASNLSLALQEELLDLLQDAALISSFAEGARQEAAQLREALQSMVTCYDLMKENAAPGTSLLASGWFEESMPWIRQALEAAPTPAPALDPEAMAAQWKEALAATTSADAIEEAWEGPLRQLKAALRQLDEATTSKGPPASRDCKESSDESN